ncbi:MAG TPA: FAD:protein FMN transferase [Chryseosolibacter sp.]
MKNSVDSESRSIRKRTLRLMGNMFTIGVISDHDRFADECIDDAVSEIQRIERLLTTFNDSSQVNEINRAAGVRPVKVDPEVFDLIARSIKISELTQGAFDITYGSLDKSLWNFDKAMTSLPDPVVARDMVRLINYRNIILQRDRCEVMLKHKGMRIGFGGIGKGYAADRAKMILTERGINSGVVNASGDLTVWGARENGELWTIGIADPDTKHPFSYLPLTNMSVATSGSYEKFAVINGKRYSHTIDPRTGLPATGLKSVTVISPFAELSDALATPVSVMGVAAGLDLINQIKEVECILIDDDDRLYLSNNISIDRKNK